jgi:bifunctional UDP-N-acetylglucosamine pyrophosphorylase/glucosamine-1-phosphate N-acetyltransferase
LKQVTAVILAAGEGKRMKSRLPKALHSFLGRTLLEHVLAAVLPVSGRQVVVIGHGGEQVKAALGEGVSYAWQENQLGTGHALLQAVPLLPEEGTVLVLYGDVPLLDTAALSAFLAVHRDGGFSATVLTANVPDATGYGRVIRSACGSLAKIAEEKDATREEKGVSEINTGTYAFEAELLRQALSELSSDNALGEYYLTDCISIMAQKGYRVAAHLIADYRLALGVNDRRQLAEAAMIMRDRINTELMEAGVTIADPASTYVDVTVSVGCDTVLLPGTVLSGRTRVGEGCSIGPFTEISDSQLGDRVTVRHSVVSGSVLGDGVTVGPFAHLRPETRLGPNVKIGDFVEIKKSEVGEGSKIPHLSYVGDATLGRGVNLGAGTIVVNYDGRKKYETKIDDGAFVGCNSNLVAPLHIGKGAFIAAGSTVTRDVPPGALALSRPEQVIKENLARRFLKKEPAEK